MTQSPINKETISNQNSRLLEALINGEKIHCFSRLRKILGIGYLNSRISDLIKNGAQIKKRWIAVKNADGKIVKVREYSI